MSEFEEGWGAGNIHDNDVMTEEDLAAFEDFLTRPSLSFYKFHPDVQIPYFATEQSACFDIICNTVHTETYTGYSPTNVKFERTVNDSQLIIMPKERVLVPTGLIFDIPTGYSVRVHARSGLSLKNGLVLVNSEGVIDSDYVDELFVMLTNISDSRIKVSAGDRVAQGELVWSMNYDMNVTDKRPGQKTDRIGGLGSTGVVAKDPGPIRPVVEPQTTTETTETVKRGRGRPKGSPNKPKAPSGTTTANLG